MHSYETQLGPPDWPEKSITLTLDQVRQIKLIKCICLNQNRVLTELTDGLTGPIDLFDWVFKFSFKIFGFKGIEPWTPNWNTSTLLLFLRNNLYLSNELFIGFQKTLVQPFTFFYGPK